MPIFTKTRRDVAKMEEGIFSYYLTATKKNKKYTWLCTLRCKEGVKCKSRAETTSKTDEETSIDIKIPHTCQEYLQNGNMVNEIEENEENFNREIVINFDEEDEDEYEENEFEENILVEDSLEESFVEDINLLEDYSNLPNNEIQELRLENDLLINENKKLKMELAAERKMNEEHENDKKIVEKKYIDLEKKYKNDIEKFNGEMVKQNDELLKLSKELAEKEANSAENTNLKNRLSQLEKELTGN
uniref:FLYWCH-type domain-containing protein n=1 Tax=Meloidogyne hapla TaxID=6305 RepID=A0A1I8BJ74_MELHA